ncbi:uncharacterized protein LOC111000802 [Pieris rapae]|uniref:uncharacterized protein LOC111000802 n=1 Tax=Pieris rapae TaxID=64459 RepID=UPI001E28059E|nr:uncharacterized protein LOC111000802 [Pieris rapae]
MTRLVITSVFILTAFIAVYGYPGSIQLNRLARSHPPSGITESVDGNTNGVNSSYEQQNKEGGAFGQQNGQLKEQQDGQNGGYGQKTPESDNDEQEEYLGPPCCKNTLFYWNGHSQQKIEPGDGQQENEAAFDQSQGQVEFGQHLDQGGFNKQQGQGSELTSGNGQS